MKPQATTNNVTPPTGLRAAKAVARDRGVDYVTIWRWAKKGWIKIVNVSGRPYVDLPSLSLFDERARNGEFWQPPAGAALRSAQVRAAKQALQEEA